MCVFYKTCTTTGAVFPPLAKTWQDLQTTRIFAVKNVMVDDDHHDDDDDGGDDDDDESFGRGDMAMRARTCIQVFFF